MSEKSICPECGKQYGGELYETARGGYGCPVCAGVDPDFQHQLIYRQQFQPAARVIKRNSGRMTSCPACGELVSYEQLTDEGPGLSCPDCQSAFEEGMSRSFNWHSDED